MTVEVPITPSVLNWAITQSGYADKDIANTLGITVDILDEWKNGTTKPRLILMRKLANLLRRQISFFLLPGKGVTH